MNFPDLVHNKNYQFWTLQITGFAGYGISFYLGVAFREQVLDYYYLYLPTICLIGMVITLGLRAIYRAMWDMSFVQRSIAVVVASYIAAIMWKAARSTIFPMFYPEYDEVMLWREYLYAMPHKKPYFHRHFVK